jgi:predicted nucleic acid-binding protein
VSTGILLEYEEVIARMSGREHWHKFARLMDYVELTTGALLRVTPHDHFQVINHDPDDNIFTDCAITATAD